MTELTRAAGPPASAVVLVLLLQGRMLMIRRAPGVPRPGVWTPPTGRIEAAETAPAAAVREAAEELGLAARAVRELWRSYTDDRRYRLHWWLLAADARGLRPDPREVAATRWITAAEFDALQPNFPTQRPFFDRILPGLLAADATASRSAQAPD